MSVPFVSSGLLAEAGHAEISANLISAAGCLASPFHARARGATIRAHLIGVAARAARDGRGHLTLHLPQDWHRDSEWPNLFEAACGPPGRPDQSGPGHRDSTAQRHPAARPR